VLFVHVSLIVQIPGSDELKSKPTQHSVKELLSIGIQPDILVCRCDAPMTDDIRKKISLFCNVEMDSVIENLTVSSLYEVPLMLHTEGLDTAVCRKLHLQTPDPDLSEWRSMVERTKKASRKVCIALVGKYTALHDAYLSVVEALSHAGTANDADVTIKWVDSEALCEENVAASLEDCDGILVPGGFGDRGTEGMILTVKYAREHRVPYFGICLGMQMAVVEFSRDVAGLKEANSSEFNENTLHPVIDLMESQIGITSKGGTMRLGKYPCILDSESLAAKAYASREISERHRHRYEFNNDYRHILKEKGLLLAGLSPDGNLVELVELPDHPWFIGVQFHPEFKSRPNRAHPLFYGFIEASLKNVQ